MMNLNNIIDTFNILKGVVYFILLFVLTILVTVAAFRLDALYGWISIIAFSLRWLTKIKFKKNDMINS